MYKLQHVLLVHCNTEFQIRREIRECKCRRHSLSPDIVLHQEELVGESIVRGRSKGPAGPASLHLIEKHAEKEHCRGSG